MATRYGIHADNPYQWDLVSLDVNPPILAGMLWPFSFQAFPNYSPAMPPVTLSTHVFVEDNAEANIRFATRQFAQRLGEKEIADRFNTRRTEWRWDSSAVVLTVWPPEKQAKWSFNNPAHQRDPRLVTACSVIVETGWRPPLSPQDRAWLEGFRVIGGTHDATPSQGETDFGRTLFSETQLEFMRHSPDDMARCCDVFGLSADGKALIVCRDALHVVPLTHIASFGLTRTLPARGGGGSALSALCETGDAACPTKSLQVARRDGADDLNEIAASMAAAAGKPLTVGAYDEDV